MLLQTREIGLTSYVTAAMPRISLRMCRLRTWAVLIVDQFEQEEMEHGNQQSNCAPEQHRQTAEVVSVLV